MQRFLKRNQDVRFNVTTPLRARLPPSKSASTKTSASAATAKECLEEITESGPAKFEFDSAISAAISVESATRLLLPSRRRLETTWLIPIGAELIVLFSFLRIPKDLVCFIDLFEFFLSRRFVFVNIRMVLTGELAECLANFVVAGGLWDSQYFVIISELYGHWICKFPSRKGYFQSRLAVPTLEGD
jgi:hypothetical protein